MKNHKDFDKIYKLGFLVIMDWNTCFSIDYILGLEPINILVCTYDESNITYPEIIESCCDIFFEWYNKNSDKLDYLSSCDLDDVILGDITKRVRRNLNLDRLL